MSNLSLRLIPSNLRRSCFFLDGIKSRTRNVHKVPPLQYPIEKGLGKFLPPLALKTVVEYQQGLLDRLNEEVKDTAEENMSVAQTVINTSTLRERTLAFNYASLALNNSFFLDHLKPPPSPDSDHEDKISIELLNHIRRSHGDLKQLKSTFSSAALSLFTNGFVWFVCDSNGATGVLPTLGPGTLLVRSRTYMGKDGLVLGQKYSDPVVSPPNAPKPQNPAWSRAQSPTPHPSPPGVSPSSPTSGISGTNTPSNPDPLRPRFLHTSASRSGLNTTPASLYSSLKPTSTASMLNVGQVLYPLFCVSVHEHAWLSAGYGVWGREEWLRQFWKVLDWQKVSMSFQAVCGNHTASTI